MTYNVFGGTLNPTLLLYWHVIVDTLDSDVLITLHTFQMHQASHTVHTAIIGIVIIISNIFWCLLIYL